MAKFSVGDKVQREWGEGTYHYEIVYVDDKPNCCNVQYYCVRNLGTGGLVVVGESELKLSPIKQKIWYVVDMKTKEILLTKPYRITMTLYEDRGVFRVHDDKENLVEWWYIDSHPHCQVREMEIEV